MSEVGKPAPTIDQAGIDHLRSWISADDVLTPRLANGFRAMLDDQGPPPLDGVTLKIDDPALVAVDARYARGPEITALLERGRAWLAGGPSADVLPSWGSD
jgi:hypothetical protein